jgi:hypothetical protein
VDDFWRVSLFVCWYCLDKVVTLGMSLGKRGLAVVLWEEYLCKLLGDFGVCAEGGDGNWLIHCGGWINT